MKIDDFVLIIHNDAVQAGQVINVMERPFLANPEEMITVRIHEKLTVFTPRSCVMPISREVYIGFNGKLIRYECNPQTGQVHSVGSLRRPVDYEER